MGVPYLLEIVAGVILLSRAIEVVTLCGSRDPLRIKVTWVALGVGGGGLILAPTLDATMQAWIEALLLAGVALLFLLDRRRRWARGSPGHG